MRKLLFVWFATVSAVLLPFASAGAAKEAVPEKLTIDRRIESIIASTNQLDEVDYELFENSSFKEMLASAEHLLPDIDRYLREYPNGSEKEIRIAVLALQCLQLPDYLAFLDRMARESKGKISPWALFYSVVPGIDWSKRLALEYKDRKVRAALKRVAASPNAEGKLRHAIAHILDGTTARAFKSDPEGPALRCKPQTKN